MTKLLSMLMIGKVPFKKWLRLNFLGTSMLSYKSCLKTNANSSFTPTYPNTIC